MELHSFRPSDNPALRSPEQNRAFAAATRLRADVEAARSAAGEEKFISTPAQMRELSGNQQFTHSKLTLMTQGEGGELRGLVQNDDNRAVQYRMSRSLAASMIGGMMGAALQGAPMDMYTRATVSEGITHVESLGVDKATGLMNFSEYQMPY